MTILPDLEAAFVEAAERHELREGPVPAGTPAAEARREAPAPSGAPRGQRRPRWQLAAGAVALACTVVVALSVVGGDEQGPLDVVARAEAALAPGDDILYVDLRIRHRPTLDSGARNSGRAALTRHVEQWSTERPRRYRSVTHESEEPARGGGPGHLQPHEEYAWADGTTSSYNRDHGVMRVTTGFSDNSSAARPPVLSMGNPPTSLETIRALLAAGKLTDRGTATVDGRRVRRLVGETVEEHGGSLVRRTRLEYDVDPSSFVPARLVERQSTQVGPGPDDVMRYVTIVDIRGYARLKPTSDNLKLLTISPPAGTKIIERTVEEARAASKEKTRREEARSHQRAAEEQAKQRP